MSGVFTFNPERAWPYDDRYACKCSQCGERYCGPKRSPSCWVCVADSTKQWWHELHPNGIVQK
jgi:hypothetical protein